jgi:hypothetical protein
VPTGLSNHPTSKLTFEVTPPQTTGMKKRLLDRVSSSMGSINGVNSVNWIPLKNPPANFSAWL